LAVHFAGDEFIIISEKHSVFELEKILETVNQNLRTTQLKHNEQTFYIDFSFGIEPFSINDAFKPTFESADRKMYLYKKSTQYK
jgi:GGDEF domain-containing protein